MATDTLTPAVKETYLTCQHLNIKIIIQHVPGKINIIADALCRLCRQRDFHVYPFYLDQIKMIQNIQITLDLFASSTTKLLPLYVQANIRDQQTQWIDAFSYTWTNQILLVHPPIPMLFRVISYLDNEATLVIIMAPWWQSQPKFTNLMNQSSRHLILGQSSQYLIKRLSIENPKSILPPGKIAAFHKNLKWRSAESSQPRFQTGQNFLEELSNCQPMD
ncbi:MAG: hypothetical protein EZS28_039037 [Streblomastix strix]|uniref:Reverse transcriptase RNase H-like domain-containing protein n=1 Tax=Streblomastix strix TaxID=222440 RepID=A0A5J4U497_9EUKA|nr:MAG: hypothetical protein EZS28_039037 [Streblomastix strix]